MQSEVDQNGNGNFDEELSGASTPLNDERATRFYDRIRGRNAAGRPKR